MSQSGTAQRDGAQQDQDVPQLRRDRVDQRLPVRVHPFGFDAGQARSYPDGTLIIQDADGFALALHPGSAAPGDEFPHFGYVCADPAEVRTVRQRLLVAGVLLVEDEDTYSYVGIKALDPDGYRVEISWER